MASTLRQLSLCEIMYRLDTETVEDWLQSAAIDPITFPDDPQILIDWFIQRDWTDTQQVCDALWKQVKFPDHTRDKLMVTCFLARQCDDTDLLKLVVVITVFEKQTVARKIVLWCFCLSLSACGYRGALFFAQRRCRLISRSKLSLNLTLNPLLILMMVSDFQHGLF